MNNKKEISDSLNRIIADSQSSNQKSEDISLSKQTSTMTTEEVVHASRTHSGSCDHCGNKIALKDKKCSACGAKWAIKMRAIDQLMFAITCFYLIAPPFYAIYSGKYLLTAVVWGVATLPFLWLAGTVGRGQKFYWKK